MSGVKNRVLLPVAYLHMVYITTNSECNQPSQILKSETAIKKSLELFSIENCGRNLPQIPLKH